MRTTYAVHVTAIAMAFVGSDALRAQEQMAGIGQGSTASVAECAQAQTRADRTIDAANRRLETARQSNSPAAMRAAVDDMQAALRQLRAEIAPCANLQGAAGAADPHAGHVMPMPNVKQATPAVPGTPVMRPGSTTPAPGAVAPATPAAGGAADPHAGHVMPGAPSAPAAVPRIAPAPPAQTLKPAPAPAADPHAGHAMPGAPATPAATPRTASPPPLTRSTKPAPPAAADPHAGMAMPTAPATQTRRSAPATAAPRATTPPPAAAADPHAGMKMPGTKPEMATTPTMTTVNNPVTDPAKLKCATKVDPRRVPNVTYLGRTYYFCSDADRAEFAKDPARYFKSPGK